MGRPSRIAALPLLLLAASAAADAAEIVRVDILGLDDAMRENVRVSLSLSEAVGRQLSARRLAYLLREAAPETREALQPFGYYSPTVDVARGGGDDAIAVTITVAPGEPVRVRDSRVAIEGEGGRDRYLRKDLAAFAPAPGAVFVDGIYEASKARIGRRLAERGYFDADLARHRVEVTRAEHAADIDLAWTSGERYDMGPVTFVQSPHAIIRPSLLDKLVYWNEGEYYHQGRLERLRQSLARLDYFSRIDIEPQPEAAVDRRVPVEVTLTPAKRSIYTAGLSYGTDSGAGVRLGVERRYLNSRGHKALAEVDWAERRKTATLQYRIPAFAWRDGWYTLGLQAADEQTDYVDSRKLELVASRSGEYNTHLTLAASLHALRERWAFAVAGGGALAAVDYRYASFLFPALDATYVDVDDRVFPRRGLSGSLQLRGGLRGAGSDADFGQVHADASWFHGLGDDTRLVARGEVGHTFGRLVRLPPSLRFYAGGERSIRGYGYREVSPRIATVAGDYSVGARNVVTGSLELERYFGGPWGAAVFVDGGSAFDSTPDWRTGVGVGLRWRSPVGPVRIDVAHGLDHPDATFQVYLSIGARL